MFLKNLLCITAIIVNCSSVSASSAAVTPQAAIIYRQAQEADKKQLLGLLDIAATQEQDRLVILPEKFRAGALEDQIRKGQIFVAQAADKIVGFKKLYVIEDPAKLTEMLAEEICALGPLPSRSHIDPAFAYHYTDKGEQAVPSSLVLNPSRDTAIYTGSDFTLKDYRGQGINSRLVQHALATHQASVLEAIKRKQSTQLLMLYGVTIENQGRSPALAKAFRQFLNGLYGKTEVNRVELNAFRAVKPSFDPKAQECVPLPAEQSVPGYGCVLNFPVPEPSLNGTTRQRSNAVGTATGLPSELSDMVAEYAYPYVQESVDLGAHERPFDPNIDSCSIA